MGNETLEDLQTFGRLDLELGVELNIDAKREAAAAVDIWLFDGIVEKLPGGYDEGELSPTIRRFENSKVFREIWCVLVGCSSIRIKRLSVQSHGNPRGAWSRSGRPSRELSCPTSIPRQSTVLPSSSGGNKRSAAAAAGDGRSSTRV
jgi:hypothetical protein